MADSKHWWPLALLAAGGLAMAADEDVPDVDFLEYLGMWESSDEEWIMFERDSKKAGDEQAEPEPGSDGPAENGDEE